jgi:hypothetical protein
MKTYIFIVVLFNILGVILYFIYKIIKRKRKEEREYFKREDEKLLKDLQTLRKNLLNETDSVKRIEIMKKIELISSIYN